MSLSDDSGDDSSSNESPPTKRKRNDTCGASSTTSYGSVVQSDEDQAETPMKYNSSNCFTLRKPSAEGNIRLSRSSLSENEQYDDIRQSFDDNDTDKEDYSIQPSFQNNDTFYNSQHAEEHKDDIDNEITGEYSEKSKRMMSNMGFKPGKGLGKYEQGRAVPVEASTQKGRRGLGLKPSEVGEVPIDFTWSPDDSKPEAKETVTWMPSPPEETLLGDQLDEWLLRGPKKLTIDDETDFVDPQILSGILKSKVFCIHKPVTSRPANSERYLICMWKKCGTESSERHLFNVNVELCNSTTVGEDISQLVPLSVIQQDREFYEYIYKSNWVLGERQIKNLLKIAAFSKDRNLKEKSQSVMREQCLKLWQLPDKVRTQPEKMNPDDTLLKILELLAKRPPESGTAHSFKANVLGELPEYIERSADLTKFKNVYDWYFMILNSERNSPDLKFFLSCGGEHVYQLEGVKWKNVVDLHITMPSKTLIYGEIVKEYQGQGGRQYFNKALHVIDAMVLGGVDISNLPLSERINQCEMFCTAVEKPFDKRAMPIRCKRLYNMEQFSKAIDNLEYRAMKNIRKALTINTPNRNRDESFYVVGSLLFLKEIKEPWMANISKKHGCKYYFYKDLPSRFEIPEEAKLDMVSTFMRRVMWPWEPSSILVFEGQAQGRLSKTDVEQYIQNCLR